MTDKIEADLVICVSGGCVQSIFGPENLKIKLIDFDNICQGGGIETFTPDGNVDCEACQTMIDEANGKIADNE